MEGYRAYRYRSSAKNKRHQCIEILFFLQCSDTQLATRLIEKLPSELRKMPGSLYEKVHIVPTRQMACWVMVHQCGLLSAVDIYPGA